MTKTIQFERFDINEYNLHNGTKIVQVIDNEEEYLNQNLVAEYVTNEDGVYFHMDENEQIRRFGSELSEQDIKDIVKHWT